MEDIYENKSKKRYQRILRIIRIKLQICDVINQWSLMWNQINVKFLFIFFSALLHAVRWGIRSGHWSGMQSGLHWVRWMWWSGWRITSRTLSHRSLDHTHRHDHLPLGGQHPPPQPSHRQLQHDLQQRQFHLTPGHTFTSWSLKS